SVKSEHSCGIPPFENRKGWGSLSIGDAGEGWASVLMLGEPAGLIFTSNKKRAAIRPPLYRSKLLEAVQKTSVDANVVVVAEAVEAQPHPVQVDGSENQFVSPEVHAAADYNRGSAHANASRSHMRATEQSVDVWREVALG